MTTAVRRLEGERMDAITARQTVNGLHLTLPFNIEFFHGAPHAGASISPLPVVWAHGDFAVDFARLLKRPTISAADRAQLTDSGVEVVISGVVKGVAETSASKDEQLHTLEGIQAEAEAEASKLKASD